MSELLDKQAIIEALKAKTDDKGMEDKPDVILGLLVAIGVVENMEGEE